MNYSVIDGLVSLLHYYNYIHYNILCYNRDTHLCALSLYNKKAVLSQGNRAMPQLFFSV